MSLPVACCLFLLAVLYLVCLTVYRALFHPLAQFPGPKLAALTYWSEFYFEVVKKGGGMFHLEVDRMHKRYDEIHVDDPSWYETLFAGGAEIRDKYAPAAHMAGTSLGTFSAVDHFVHRQRRAIIGPLFSKHEVYAREALLQTKLTLLWNALEEHGRIYGAVDIHAAFLAYATDVFCEYFLGYSPHPDLLPNPRRQIEWRETIGSIEDLTPIMKQLHFVTPFVNKVPSWTLQWVAPGMARVLRMKEGMRAIAREQIRRWKSQKESNTNKASANIFTAIINSKTLDAEKSVDRLEQESFEVLSASGQTLSRVLTCSIFHLLSTPDKLERLREEVGQQTEKVCEGVLLLREIEKLPYLFAVVKESVRISAIVLSRLPVTAPVSTLSYRGRAIPAGTPISMTPARILLNERCFPQPLCFQPERWLGEMGLNIPLEKYFVAFSRGHRACPGINIAYAEMSLILANMVVRYDMRLVDTTRKRDVDHSRDCFLGKPDRSSKGVKVALRRRS